MYICFLCHHPMLEGQPVFHKDTIPFVHRVCVNSHAQRYKSWKHYEYYAMPDWKPTLDDMDQKRLNYGR